MTEVEDPARKAAQELTTLFQRLDVACEVCITADEGKHVKATADLSSGYALVEEAPIVSWPTSSFLRLDIPFCFQCLRLQRHNVLAVASDGGAPTVEGRWSTKLCSVCGACFCSTECSDAAARAHRLLCSSLRRLRSATATDVSSPTLHDSDITVESLARCVVWIVCRLSTAIEQQGLTHEQLQSDYASFRTESGGFRSGSSIVYQLFTQSVAPFTRLISPPNGTTFAGISLPAWRTIVREALCQSSVKLLLCSSGASFSEIQWAPLHFDDAPISQSQSTITPTTAAAQSVAPDPTSKRKGGTAAQQPSLPSLWAEAVVQSIFSTDTLSTLVGQMELNGHAVNDFVFPSSTCASASPPMQPTVSAPASGTDGAAKFEWVIKGAGLYTLLSSFNHSCNPNTAVQCVDGTSEIRLETIRPVRKGEELSITYIPLPEGSTPAERRQQLKSYFFNCRCDRCVSEDVKAA